MSSMMSMFAKKKAPESEEVESEEEADAGAPRESEGKQKTSEYDLDVEADGEDPATAASVVAALYAKYKKNVRRNPDVPASPPCVPLFPLALGDIFAHP
jgi:hypothetical protein